MWISHAQFSRDVAFLLFVLSPEYVLFTPGEVSVIHGKSGELRLSGGDAR